MEIEPIFRRAYALGGNAKLTLVSKRTQERFTYQLRSKGTGAEEVFFVSVLTGSENTSDYQYLGTIFEEGKRFVHTKKSKITPQAPSALAFAWFWRNVGSLDIEVYHSGACSRCGRELTTPESIKRGLGPVCATRRAA